MPKRSSIITTSRAPRLGAPLQKFIGGIRQTPQNNLTQRIVTSPYFSKALVGKRGSFFVKKERRKKHLTEDDDDVNLLMDEKRRKK